MCRKGQSPMQTAYLKQMARLPQTYKDLHPYRIARRYGVREAFVRELESRYQLEELPPLCEALEVLYRAPGRCLDASSAAARSALRLTLDDG